MAVTAKVLFWCDRCNRCEERAVGSADELDGSGYVKLGTYVPSQDGLPGGWQRWQTLKPFGQKLLLLCPECWMAVCVFARRIPAPGAAPCEYIVDHDHNVCGATPTQRYSWPGGGYEWRCARHAPLSLAPALGERE